MSKNYETMTEKYEVQLLGYEDYRKESNRLKIGVGIFEQKIQIKKILKRKIQRITENMLVRFWLSIKAFLERLKYLDMIIKYKY